MSDATLHVTLGLIALHGAFVAGGFLLARWEARDPARSAERAASRGDEAGPVPVGGREDGAVPHSPLAL